MMKDAINWFEIPAKDFERAQKFYETLLEVKITEMPFPDGKYGVFPSDKEKQGVGGGLVQMEGYVPSAEGVTIYLPGGDDLNTPLGRIEAAGGKVVMPKTSIGENGFMALFMDTEGNRLALHSLN
jgi:uncharacterized protein